MNHMRVVRVPKPKEAFELIELPIPEPGAGIVRIKVQACAVCHSDCLTKEGLWPGIQYPRIPGHEVTGIVDAVGSGVTIWKQGDRVGVGWHGGHCGTCNSCRRGDFLACVSGQVSGITMDGGYSDFMLAPANVLARIPDELSPVEAAPLLCAGITTFNSLRHAGAIAGETVAVLGLGGLGHLGVQFASRMGYRTVAIARGAEKEDFAKKLGAHHYIDSLAQDPAVELNKLGGARVILATVTNAKAMSATVGGLGINGKLVILGAPHEPLEIAPGPMIGGRRSVSGWPSGTAMDSQDTMNFSAMTGVRSMNEVYPLERAEDAYNRMMSGKARFKVVITTGN